MSRFGFFLSLTAALFLYSCGFPGPVQPPSLHIPVAVNDLSVVQRGDKVTYSFTLPELTTDNTAIRDVKTVDFRIGPDIKPFDYPAWAARAKPIEVPEPVQAAARTGGGTVLRIESSFPAANWTGKDVVLGVRTAARGDRFSQWSNLMRTRIVEAPQTPKVTADSDPKGVRLTIEPTQKEVKFRILRQGPNDIQPVQAGITDGPEFIDTEAEYSVKYRYTVVAFSSEEHANAESNPSDPIEFTAIDQFPPSTPLNLTALAGISSIEASWERSPEPDTKGYYIYKSVDGGPFVRLNDLMTLPAFSDKDVQAGKKYRYEVSAVDVRNLESTPSNPVEAGF
jgi:hypothetical protein